MKRRKFIKKSLLVTAGAMFTPNLFISSCTKEPVLPDSQFTGKIIIIGAGASGMYAAYLLQKHGYDYEILEASSQIGGRLGKNIDFTDHTIDVGAQWLHGKKSIAGDLIQLKNVEIKHDNSDVHYLFNNAIVEKLPEDVVKIFGKTDASDVSFSDYATEKGYGPEYQNIVESIAGDYGADSHEISAYQAAKEEENWSAGNKDYKFEKSFFDLFGEHIIPIIGSNISLNKVVQSIDYSGDEISIVDTNNVVHVCNKVLVTVPLPILQDGDISFVPNFSATKIAAFNKIGMGPGMKVFLKFSSKFYHENIVGGSVCAAYADDKVGKPGSDNVLLAFIMGQQAQNLTNLGSDQAIINALLIELDGMYNSQATANFLSGIVIDWTSNPFVRGAYSYATIGLGDARAVAAESVNNKVFFAGEAMNLNGHHQTVHGAMETGFEQVSKILENA